MFTIDTSVWINGDSPTEDHSAFSREFLDRIAKDKLEVLVPTLLRAELAGTVSRLSDDPAKAIAFANAIHALPFLRWISLDEQIARVAAEVAARHKLRGADSVYAAVAMEYGCQLVSLDKEHLKRLVGVLDVVTPDGALARLKKPGP